MRAFAYLTGVIIGLIDALLAVHIWTLGFASPVPILVASLSGPSILGTLLAPRLCVHVGRRTPNCVGAACLGVGAIIIASCAANQTGGGDTGLCSAVAYGIGYGFIGLGHGTL